MRQAIRLRDVAAQRERLLNGGGSFYRKRQSRQRAAAVYTRLTPTCKGPSIVRLGFGMEASASLSR